MQTLPHRFFLPTTTTTIASHPFATPRGHAMADDSPQVSPPSSPAHPLADHSRWVAGCPPRHRPARLARPNNDTDDSDRRRRERRRRGHPRKGPADEETEDGRRRERTHGPGEYPPPLPAATSPPTPSFRKPHVNQPHENARPPGWPPDGTRTNPNASKPHPSDAPHTTSPSPSPLPS